MASAEETLTPEVVETFRAADKYNVGWDNTVHDEGEITLDARIHHLVSVLDTGLVRLVGTNVIGECVDIPDDELLRAARYSIIDGSDISITGSRIEYSCIGEDSEVVSSTILGSLITRSIVHYSNIEASSVGNINMGLYNLIDDSRIRGSYITESTLLDVTVVRDSSVNGVTGNFLNIQDGDIVGRRDFVDFGKVIGTGQRVYAYINKEDKLVIRAGCKDFSSAAEMLSYAKTAREYADFSDRTKRLYLRQIRAACTLINATMELRATR